MEQFRIERDTLGEIAVPQQKYWGAQTERSKQNFRIGTERMPIEMIYAFAKVKRATATVNYELGKLSLEKKQAISEVCTEILSGQLDEHFPLVVWQTGSGTQTNMNVNEVIARRANELLKEKNVHTTIHPNDDVNMSQSSNDTFPTAMHVASVIKVNDLLIPAIQKFIETLREKEGRFSDMIKIGRTHLQDATPLTVGQEMSGWRAMLEKDLHMIESAKKQLLDLAIGGTAVGTGLNAEVEFGKLVAQQIAADTAVPFRSSANKFQSLTSHDEIVFLHGALKALAADVMKIANDVRWLASGPRSGLGELILPVNEPGSSIMPGKINPTQSEALTMIVCQVFGNDTTIGFAASQGNFQLNVFKPVIIHNLLQSIQLLADGMNSFHEKCLIGLDVNKEVIASFVDRSLMLVTSLSPHIGYEKAAEIAQLAHEENKTLKEAAIQLNYVTSEQFDEWVDVKKMV